MKFWLLAEFVRKNIHNFAKRKFMQRLGMVFLVFISCFIPPIVQDRILGYSSKRADNSCVESWGNKDLPQSHPPRAEPHCRFRWETAAESYNLQLLRNRLIFSVATVLFLASLPSSSYGFAPDRLVWRKNLPFFFYFPCHLQEFLLEIRISHLMETRLTRGFSVTARWVVNVNAPPEHPCGVCVCPWRWRGTFN